MAAALESMPQRQFVQFTNFPYNYPMSAPGFCSFAVTPAHQLVYTFSFKDAARALLENMQKWSGLIQHKFLEKHKFTIPYRVDVYENRPFEKASEFFPAQPQVEGHYVVVLFPPMQPQMQVLAPYFFSQIIGEIGVQLKVISPHQPPEDFHPVPLSEPALSQPKSAPVPGHPPPIQLPEDDLSLPPPVLQRGKHVPEVLFTDPSKWRG